MFSRSITSTIVENEKKSVELLLDPLDENLTELVLSLLTGNKLYATRLADVNLDPLIVEKSKPIFTYISEKEDGSDNDSELQTDAASENNNDHVIPENDTGKQIFELNAGFKYEDSNIEQDGQNYVSTEKGLFIIENDAPKIIPVCFDGSAEVRLSDDKMFVYVDIYPSIGSNPIPSVEEIIEKVDALSIKTDINIQLLKEKVDDVEKNKSKHINLCISKGKAPTNGIDGRLENKTKKKEKIENFQFDEFHKLNPVISVKEGETVAILHPPTDGEPGYDVFMKIVEPKPGKPFNIKLGTNTQFSEENENHIIAKADGFVNLSDSSISITDTFTVHGDIDFKSGNIVSKGSLKVTGDVKNEFTLSLSKDIEIGGYIGDAFVEAGQKLKVHGGFLGKGRGIIKTGGDAELKFVENQQVYCRGSLSLIKETLNAKLFVKKDIISKGSSCSIIGGLAIAGNTIEINNLGNLSESETIVEVGFDYLKRNSIEDNKSKQVKLREKLEEVDKQLFEFAKMKRLNTKCGEKVKLLAAQHKKLIAEIEELKEANIKITSEIYIPTSSKVIVKGTAFPGVKVGINGRFMIINNPIRSKTFILSKDNEVIAV